MQKIISIFWLDHNATEAIDFYISVFGNGKIISQSHYPKTEEEGLVDFQKGLG